MKKRGRISAAERAMMPAQSAYDRIQPPPELSATEAQLFRELVASVADKHFVYSDTPLLAAYCQCVVACRHWAKQSRRNPKLVVTWERTLRMVATLATRLRLAPQARTRPETTARRQPNGPPSYYDVMKTEGWS